jgi:hypothetical protein
VKQRGLFEPLPLTQEQITANFRRWMAARRAERDVTDAADAAENAAAFPRLLKVATVMRKEYGGHNGVTAAIDGFRPVLTEAQDALRPKCKCCDWQEAT